MRIEGISSVEMRRALIETPEVAGVSVTEACALYGVSRETFYYWQRRFEAEGEAGLETRSTAPHESPGRIGPTLEAQIVEYRRAHPRWGARRIRAEMLRRGQDPPARSTIERVLHRNGLIARSEPKPPPSIRFERSKVNELWQTDAKEWALSDGTLVQIISCLDDRSRMCGASIAFPSLSSAAAIAVFDAACEMLGQPESVLSDRGAIFTARRTNTVGEFERHLWVRGTYTINGRARHPQTQGKIERFHRTLIEWLEDEGPYASIDELNASLEAMRQHYNHERPHQSLGEAVTPADVFTIVEHARPAPALASERCRRETIRPTGKNGNVSYGDWVIGLGMIWGNSKVRIVDLGAVIEVWSADGTHIRTTPADATQRYIATGKKRGRPTL